MAGESREKELSWMEKERRVRQLLGDKHNVPFSKERLVLGTKSNGAPCLHQFDLYSEGGQIVGEIKSFRRSSDEAANSVNFECCLADLYRLERVNAEKKLFVLTEKAFYEYFISQADGLVTNVEVLFIDVESGS